jgi:hypothetical protein
MQSVRLLTLLSILSMAVAQQPRLAAGFSSPALTWVSETTCQLSDSFDGDSVDPNLWLVYVDANRSDYGAFIDVTGDGALEMYSGLTPPAGEQANAIGLISKESFAPQSFKLITSITIESYEDVGFFSVGVLDRFGESASTAFLVGMGVMLVHTPPGNIDQIIVGDGSITPGLEWFPFSGLFSKLKGNTTDIMIDYDHDEKQMNVTITGPNIAFSVNRTALYPNDRDIKYLAGNFLYGVNYRAEDRIKVDHITTTFEWIKPAGFEASLSPFELDGVVYDGEGFEFFPSPNTIFLTKTSEPSQIIQDGTVVPADGITSYNLALVTIDSSPGSSPGSPPVFATVITDLSESEAYDIPNVSLTVDAFLENAYVAQGPENDYLFSIAEGPEAELQDLSEIIVPGFGPGKSLLNKLDNLIELYANGDYEGALAMSHALANQVSAQRGKKINEADAVKILSLLDDFDAKLRTLLSP